MNASLWLWGALAVSVFWGVGVYNRLMRMQVRGLAALRSVEKHMQRCAKLMDAHVSQFADQQTSADEGGAERGILAWTQLLDTMHHLDRVLKDAKGSPLGSQSVASVGHAFEAAQDAWHQWYAGQSAYNDVVVPDAMRVQWEGAALQVQVARAGLNQILSKYNEAINQYPARLLVGVMGFKPAGRM